jgi:hypothetical protein
MRFTGALLFITTLAAVAAPTSSAIRFTDPPCPEAGPGGARICPAGVAGTSYAIELEGSGGCGPDPGVPGSGLPYQFAVLAGTPPPGLSLAKDGRLTGVPARAGSWAFWVQLSDQDPPSGSWCVPSKSEREFTVRVDPPRARVGTVYSVAAGAPGDGRWLWSLASGRLPPGLSLDPTTGSIAGTPQVGGAFRFTLTARSLSETTSVVLAVTVLPKLVIATTRLAPVLVGHRSRASVRTNGAVGRVTFEALAGRFPVGVRLNQATGTLIGVPRRAGTYSFAIQARDALGATARRNFVLTVRGPSRITGRSSKAAGADNLSRAPS